MSGFTIHPLVSGAKVKITALYQSGDRLYVGCANGTLQVYAFEPADGVQNGGPPTVRLLKSYALGKRAIEQIGVLEESKQIIILSDSSISLYPLPDITKPSPTVLSQARNAHGFAVTSYTTKFVPKKKSSSGSGSLDSQWVTRDLLVVGCRKKVVVYGAGKGGLMEAWELSLPHSPRHVIFPTVASSSTSSPLPETVHLLFSPTSSALLHIQPSSAQRLSISDLPPNPIPPPALQGALSTISESQNAPGAGASDANTAAASGGLSMGIGGMSALTGLGGYVGLGKGAAIPVGTRTVGGEVLLAREDLGVFYSSEGNPTRSESLQWPTPPEALAFSNPYIYSAMILPSPTMTQTGKNNATSSVLPIPAIQINLGPTLALRESIQLVAPSAGTLTIHSLTTLHSPSSSTVSSSASPSQVLFVTTPTDKALSISEGSSIWTTQAPDLGSQIDQLVKEGRVADAIGLVDAVGEGDLSSSRRLPHLKTVLAVSQFSQGQYQSAIDTFLTFNVNSALVLSLYPEETISGPLHVPKQEWMHLFGAVEGAQLSPQIPSSQDDTSESITSAAKGLLKGMAHLTLAKKSSTETLKTTGSGKNEEGTPEAPLGDEKPAPVMSGEEAMAPRAALEALMYFLSDRRQKLTGAIASLATPLPAESDFPPLSSVPAGDLHALPSNPMSEYTSEQLLRMAQIIYTGLLKVYLVARPILVGSLCRIENWCDVDEVEELLKAQKKFGDLIDLYQGKKMHSKALKMLHQLAKDEDDKLDKYPPTIRYLQKLGPTELPLILESARWVFDEEPKMALQIFTADEAEVEALPRKEVMLYLEKVNTESCIGYLEHVIDNLDEQGADLHDKLAELYMDKARASNKSAPNAGKTPEYERLLSFLSTSVTYRPYRLLSRLSGDEMPEVRAILLGRMGNHEEALQIYVYRLEDYSAAEIYCARVYAKEPDPHGIFLLLLRLYLRPATTKKTNEKPILLRPALALIAKHGVRLDAEEVLDLLPPLVTMEDIKAFFIRTLRDGHSKRNEHRLVRNLLSSRKEEVERGLMGLQSRRVRITDQRICPQCHKRLGQSAIAVHVPKGEVTHLHCKDQFSEKLAKLRS